jgi:hypothetical protein
MPTETPPNNPLKLPTYAAYAVLGVVLVGVGVVSPAQGAWLLAVIGLVILVPSAIAVRTILQGRNPRWIRSPVDHSWHAGGRW